MAETLREFVREYRIEKEERWARYRVLVAEAERAGQAAADAVRVRAPRARRRGMVRVQVADGRSSFAGFLRAEDVPGWVRGSRRTGMYRPAPESGDFDKAMAWAAAVRDVLTGGGVDVLVVQRIYRQGQG